MAPFRLYNLIIIPTDTFMMCRIISGLSFDYIDQVYLPCNMYACVIRYCGTPLSGRGGAVVRARSSDIVVGGCEFESRHCQLTGHIPDQLMSGPLITP